MHSASFLHLLDRSTEEVAELLLRAHVLKESRGLESKVFAGKTLGLLFEKASTRTRVSFEVAAAELGGHSVFLSGQGTQMSRGEPIEDTARVLGRYCHILAVRTFEQTRLEVIAEAAGIPVINALTDSFHPCQVLADLFVIQQEFGTLDVPVAWVGDGNNMAHSWLLGAARTGVQVRMSCPTGYQPNAEILRHARGLGADVQLFESPREAVAGARVVCTDVWASMGSEGEADARVQAFRGFTVDEVLMDAAHPSAIVLHCLPAHRGEEISTEVLEGAQSRVWDQAEARLHVQKALLEGILGRAYQGTKSA